MEQGASQFRLVWWVPTEYWKESFRNVATMTDDQKEEFYHAVDDYIVLVVVDAKISAFGGVNPISRGEILSSLSLSIDQGQQMLPLPDAEVSSDASTIFAMMKPVIANMAGQFGKGMEFIYFKGVDSKGKRLLNPLEGGAFSVTLGESIYKWRLPLGSLLPPNYDGKTGEKFPGNYLYNPFTGDKLVSVPLN